MPMFTEDMTDDSRNTIAEEIMTAYPDVSPDIIAGIARYSTQRIPCGSFLNAVYRNDLATAMAKADLQSQRTLPDIIMILNWYAPATIWGSAEKFDTWVDGGDPLTCYPESGKVREIGSRLLPSATDDVIVLKNALAEKRAGHQLAGDLANKLHDDATVRGLMPNDIRWNSIASGGDDLSTSCEFRGHLCQGYVEIRVSAFNDGTIGLNFRGITPSDARTIIASIRRRVE